MTRENIVVVGAGIAGLTAATYLARAGARVRLLEKSKHLGGRARTNVHSGFHLNQGPHALYAAGAGRAVLDDLGIAFRGTKVVGRGHALRRGRMHTLPIGLLSMLSTGLFGLTAKIQAARTLAALPGLDTRAFMDISYREWVERACDVPVVREFLHASGRLATYLHAPDRMPAGVVLQQLQIGFTHGVFYLDGGWQTLIDGLRTACTAAGVAIESGTRVDRLGDLHADAVVLATDPTTAGRLLGREFTGLVAARAACLDLALRELPRPNHTFALGIDTPVYYSVHTHYADLSPARGAVVHVARYLAPDEKPAPGPMCEQLEAILDQLQPGWRSQVVHQRFLPRIVVSHAMPTLAGRPGCAAGDRVFLAGDWVGEEGLLADAAFASGRRAARLILSRGQEEARAA